MEAIGQKNAKGTIHMVATPIAAVTQSRFRTGLNDRTKEENTGQKADDPDLAKHLDTIIMWMRMAPT